MIKRLIVPALATALAWLAAPVLADEIYRWVDDQGQVHYSDVPRDGAEQVELKPAQTFVGQRVNRTSSAPEPEDESVAPYSSLEITSPAQEETIWNTGGVITVAVNPVPGLKPGHSLNISYDGNLVGGGGLRTTSTQLSGVYRGAHTLQATIVDAAGNTLITAPPVTFYYQRSTQENVVPTPAGSTRPAARGERGIPTRVRN